MRRAGEMIGGEIVGAEKEVWDMEPGN